MQALRTATLFKSDFNTGAFLWILQNFYEQLFLKNTSGGCFYRFDKVTVCLVMGICRSSLFNQIHIKNGFYYKGLQTWSEYVNCAVLVEIIPTDFYWLTCRKQKLVEIKALQQRLFDLKNVDKFLFTNYCLF